MSAIEMKASRRIVAAPAQAYRGVDGRLRFALVGQEVDLPAAEEVRLEADGCLVPNRPALIGAMSANRPGAGDMLEVAKRGPRLAARVLAAEEMAGREARPAVLEAARKLAGASA